jgi:hypothetical protein
MANEKKWSPINIRSLQKKLAKYFEEGKMYLRAAGDHYDYLSIVYVVEHVNTYEGSGKRWSMVHYFIDEAKPKRDYKDDCDCTFRNYYEIDWTIKEYLKREKIVNIDSLDFARWSTIMWNQLERTRSGGF